MEVHNGIKAAFKDFAFNLENIVSITSSSRLSDRTNLIKNGSAEDGFNHWCKIDYSVGMEFFSEFLHDKKEQTAKELIEKYLGRCKKPDLERWRVEDYDPQETKEITEQRQMPVKNFATSYLWAFKMQVIDLKLEYQLLRRFVDRKMDLKLEISENYAPRWDCGSKYRLHVLMVDEDFKLLDEFNFADVMDQFSGKDWKMVEHTFKITKPFRYLIFVHGGKDTHIFDGFYGSKMTNAIVRFSI